MQRTSDRPPAHEPLRGRDVAIVEAEYADDLSLDDIARRVASSRRQLQRAYAEIGHTTFREHLTRVRMDRAAELLANGAADRARRRAPRRLPPARAVREGLPPPPRRRPLGYRSAARRPHPAAAHRAEPPERRPSAAAPRAERRSRRDCRSSSVALGVSAPMGEESTGGRPTRESAPRPWRQMRGRSASIASAIGIALGARDRLVPGRRRRQQADDRHALGRPDDRLGAGLRARDDRRPLLRRATSACGPARSTRTARRSTATRGSRSSGPRCPALIIVALCAYAYVVLRDIEKAPANAANEMHVKVTGEQFAWTFTYPRGRRQARQPNAARTCPRAARSSSTSTPRTSCTTSGCRPGA